MKKINYLFLLFYSISFSQLSTDPSPFEVNQSVTITVDADSNDTNCNGFNSPNKVYMHSGIGTDSNPWGLSVIGNWGQDDGVGEMTDNGDGTWNVNYESDTAIGGFAKLSNDKISLKSELFSNDGKKKFEFQSSGHFRESKEIGYKVGKELLKKAGPDFITQGN